MIKRINFNIVLVVLIGVLLCNCNNLEKNRNPVKKERTKKILVSGSGRLTDDLIATLVEKSEVLGGGYILLIPVGILTSDESVLFLKNKIENACPNAVHILNINNSIKLLPSQIIMVEGAKLIIFNGNNLEGFMNYKYIESLSQAIRNAYNNRSTIVGLNYAGGLMGDKIIRRKYPLQETTNIKLSENLKLIDGLNLVQGVIIDCKFSNNLEDEVNSPKVFIDQLNYKYIGIRTVGLAYLEESVLHNMGESDITMKPEGVEAEWTSIKVSRKKDINR